MNKEIQPEEDKVEQEAVAAENKMSIIGYIKKFKLYIAIGLGVIAVSTVALILFSGEGPKDPNLADMNSESGHEQAVSNSDQKSSDNHNQGNHPEPAINSESHTELSTSDSQSEPSLDEAIYEWSPEELIELARLKSEPIEDAPQDSNSLFDIDTSEIIADLEEIFALPDVDESILNMTPQDSIDTVNWIEKERQRLAIEKEEITKSKKELQQMESDVSQALIRINQAESQRIIKLARLYDNMKPNEVAKLFVSLSDSTIMKILPRMKPANASKIMALMPPRRAAKISQRMLTILEN